MIRVKNIAKHVCLVLIIVLSLLLSACGETKVEVKSAKFSVTYLDVGEGDCALIKFPDNKIALIDTGVNTDENYHKIVDAMSSLNIDSIQWLILTHPDLEHIGCATRLIENVHINSIYIPDVRDKMLFSSIKEIEDCAKLKEIPCVISAWGEDMSGKDYVLKFLAPLPSMISESTYVDLNLTDEPTGKQINNVSAIVYVEYKGVRFLFTGDAEMEAEDMLIDSAKVGIFKNVNLTNLHFLKVGGHGSKNCSGEYLLGYVKPQNAVISSGDSFNNHPATETLLRIIEVNPKCNILRTDVYGNITVTVNESGEYFIENQIK